MHQHTHGSRDNDQFYLAQEGATTAGTALGGKNESSLNIDFVLLNASLLIDRRLVVDQGQLLV
jgi:hypothetical protein